MTRVAQKKSLGGMLRSLKKQSSTNSDDPPSTPGGTEGTPRPRKKLSFKEPEIFGILRMQKSQHRHRPPPLAFNKNFSFDENPFEEENSDLEELEVLTNKSKTKVHTKVIFKDKIIIFFLNYNWYFFRVKP